MLRTGEMLLVTRSNAAVHAAHVQAHTRASCPHRTQARIQQESKRDRGEELAGRRDIAWVFDLSIDLRHIRGATTIELVALMYSDPDISAKSCTQRYKRFQHRVDTQQTACHAP